MLNPIKASLLRFRLAFFTCLILFVIVLTMLTSGIAMAGQAPGGSHTAEATPTTVGE
jgi:hypothetical protein